MPRRWPSLAGVFLRKGIALRGAGRRTAFQTVPEFLPESGMTERDFRATW